MGKNVQTIYFLA